jgi:hypothetical protein
MTSRKIPFVACHSLKGRSAAAAEVHWHMYWATFSTAQPIDQDEFIAALCAKFSGLHGANLNHFMDDSSDEGLARYLLANAPHRVDSVKVETDGVRESCAP